MTSPDGVITRGSMGNRFPHCNYVMTSGSDGKCLLVGPSLPQAPWHDFSVGQRAYHLRQFAQKSVIPAFRRHEASAWSDQPKQQHHWHRWNRRSWTLADVARYGISIPDVQAWIRLKLQGFFTDDDNEGQSPAKTCSFCGLVTPENLNHLFVDCAACRQILPAALLMASPKTISSVGSLLPNVVDVIDWIAAAGRLHKARKRN